MPVGVVESVSVVQLDGVDVNEPDVDTDGVTVTRGESVPVPLTVDEGESVVNVDAVTESESSDEAVGKSDPVIVPVTDTRLVTVRIDDAEEDGHADALGNCVRETTLVRVTVAVGHGAGESELDAETVEHAVASVVAVEKPLLEADPLADGVAVAVFVAVAVCDVEPDSHDDAVDECETSGEPEGSDVPDGRNGVAVCGAL